MKFMVDECTGPGVASWLRNQDHDVFSVFDEARGMDDEGIITKALEDDRILITNDKGFGEKVYRDGRLHKGVILLRLGVSSLLKPGRPPFRPFSCHKIALAIL